MSRYSGNQAAKMIGLKPKSNYGPGPTDAGHTTDNLPVLPKTRTIPYITAATGQWEDGTDVQQYKNPDKINVGQGRNHKGNI